MESDLGDISAFLEFNFEDSRFRAGQVLVPPFLHLSLIPFSSPSISDLVLLVLQSIEVAASKKVIFPCQGVEEPVQVGLLYSDFSVHFQTLPLSLPHSFLLPFNI